MKVCEALQDLIMSFKALHGPMMPYKAFTDFGRPLNVLPKAFKQLKHDLLKGIQRISKGF